MRRALALLVVLATLVPATALAGGTVCPGPNIMNGIDISSWQGNIDWAKVKAAKHYAIIRVSDGTYQDKLFGANWAAAKKVGILRGVYQFFEPAVDPIVQANLLLSKMGPMTPGMLPPMIDVEATGNQSPAVVEAQIQKWVAHVKAKTGRDPIVYTGKYFWDDHVKSNAQAYLPMAHAQYCSNCCPNLAAPWNKWAIWQHSSKGAVPGIGGNVDLDKWNGDLASLQKFAGQGSCKAHCEGDLLVGTNCGKGDCSKFAAKCVDDSLGARCASVFCPAKGNATVCLPDPKNAKLGTCKDGALSTGNCAAFGATCVSAGGKATCQAGCKLHCDGTKIIDANCKASDCAPLAATCVADDLGVRCKSNFCPAKGGATVCLPDAQHSKIGTCLNGALTTNECGAFGAMCSTAMTPNKCVAVFCAAAFDKKPVAQDVCLPGGKRYACDATGGITVKPCPAGQSCVTGSGGVATCASACKPHCEGTVMVDATCGKGDCAKYAASCVDDDVGVRCTSVFCPAKGSASVCLDVIKPGLLGTCSDGSIAQTPCATGETCSAAGGKAAHCASVTCIGTSKDAPVAHDVCLADGAHAHCDDAGVLTPSPCATGETCTAENGTAKCAGPTCTPQCTGTVALAADCSETDCNPMGLQCVADDLGARCVDAACPAQGASQICLTDKGPSAMGVCQDGALKVLDCAGQDAWCGTLIDGAACIAKACSTGPGDMPTDREVCTEQGRIHCTASGEALPDPCADGTCNACGGCGAVPVETCNGLDDDCNGEVDDVTGATCSTDAPDGGGTARAGEEDASTGDASTLGLDGGTWLGDTWAGSAVQASPASGCTAGSGRGTSGFLLGLLLAISGLAVRRRRA